MKRSIVTVVSWVALVGASGGSGFAETEPPPVERAEPEATDPEAAEAEAAEREPAPRRADASWGEIFAGPFQTSRLFAMPTAEVVGAYQLSLSGDASLVNEANVLSSSGVAAIGFGDIAQLEYRASNAISLEPTAATARSRLEGAPTESEALPRSQRRSR